LTYIKIAGRYIREYRSRSVGIVLSIALSVLLIVAIGSLAETARVLQVNDVRQNAGANHVTYIGLNKEQIDKVKQEESVKEAANSFSYDTWNGNNGLNVNVRAGEEKILYMLDTKIAEGRYPTAPDEIAVEKWVLDRLSLPAQLTQNIKVSLGENGEQEFKLVGIVKDRVHSQSHDLRDAFVAFDEQKLAGREDSVETAVEFKEGAGYKNEAMRLGKEIGIKDQEQIVLNEMLLSAMGELEAIDWNLVGVSLLLMIVGGMVVYSLYSISVLKRSQEYGMMRAVGGTRKQILAIILCEILIFYAAGAALGLFMGISATYCFKGTTMTDLFTEGTSRLDIIAISGFAVKLALLSSLAAILLAGSRGAVMANSVSPIEAINRSTQDRDIKLKGEDSLVERLMTITGKISYKNLRRNKKVLIFTVTAMVIGSTFFMTASFKEELNRRGRVTLESIGDKSPWCDFWLNISMDEPMKKGFTAEQLDEIREMPQVESMSSKQVLYSKLILDKEKQLNKSNGENYLKFMNERGFLPKFLGDFSWPGDTEDEVIVRNTVLGLPERDLQYLARTFKILQGEEIDTSRMKDEPLAVLYIPETKANGVPYDAKAKGKYAPVLNIKSGDKIRLTFPKEGYAAGMNNIELLAEQEKYGSSYQEKEFTVIGMVEELLYADGTAAGSRIAPYVLISENMFQELSGIDVQRVVTINLKENADDKDYELVKEKVQKLSQLFKGTVLADYYKYEIAEEKSAVTAGLLQSSIVIILFLISGLSIYNNINYSLISRIREHGIMKAVGLTKRQFRGMIRSEGLMHGTIAAFFSCIAALVIEAGIFVYRVYIFPVYVWPIHTNAKQFFIDWKSMLIVIVINLAIGYLATIGPGRAVDRMEITEAIRTVE
jgi:putative ABC transport system permease protein